MRGFSSFVPSLPTRSRDDLSVARLLRIRMGAIAAVSVTPN